jgi:hypothetical protein
VLCGHLGINPPNLASLKSPKRALGAPFFVFLLSTAFGKVIEKGGEYLITEDFQLKSAHIEDSVSR